MSQDESNHTDQALMQAAGSDESPLVVGIGASAGGLEAFQEFISGLPADHDMAIVLVQHLDPDHESLMPELITKRTSSPVLSVEDGMKVEAGSIYLMPPAFEMDIEDGILKLVEFSHPRGLRRPINRFFTSLARDAGENAVAIVLSGTGTDGTDGVMNVHEGGGVVLVQDPKEAKYSGMPQSVIEARAEDMVLRAKDMAEVIQDYRSIRNEIGPTIRSDGEVLDRIVRHVKYRTGHDFSGYKSGTIVRRITVRMSACGIDKPADYLRHLVDDTSEAMRLFRDLLINVTSFFRDPEMFETVAKSVIPKIVADAQDSGVIRVWVAGCSTGQEAYTLAILILEELDRTKQFANVTVFATDIDMDAVRVGRTGRYSQDIMDQVPSDYLQRYFTPRPKGYEVSDQLREIVRFSEHNLTRDPPFASVDLISCRNVLIYMDEGLQDLAMRVFHYGLRRDGYLFIGPSENPKTIAKHFDEIAPRERIYMRNQIAARPLNLPWSALGTANQTDRSMQPNNATTTPRRSTDLTQVMIDRHLPPHIHVGAGRDIRFISEGAVRYLSLSAGAVKTQLLDLLNPDIARPFRSLLNEDFEKQQSYEIEHTGTLNGKDLRFILTAERLEDASLLLVIKDQLQVSPNRKGSPTSAPADVEAYVTQLENSLDDAKSEISSTVEELETSNEELKSSNEEMMSMNEELQSANEELTTINDELQENVRALKIANDDLGNFMRSADVAIVFLTNALDIRAFSPKATSIFSFSEGDQGRPASEFTALIDVENVLDLCKLTLADRKDRTKTFANKENTKSFRVRVSPYVDTDDRVDGVVLAVDETTDLVNAVTLADEQKDAAERALQEIEQLYAVSPQAMALMDQDLRYIRINPKMAEVNGKPASDHIGKTTAQMVPGVADDAEAAIREVFETGIAVTNKKIIGRTASNPDEDRTWKVDYFPLRQGNTIFAVGINVNDITDQIEIADNLRLIMHELEHRVKNMLANVTALITRARSEVTADQDIYEKLVKRIEGLAKTHSLLTSERWSSAPILSVFEPETAAVYGPERVTLRGPDIRLNAQSVLGLGMAIHELSTNAAKYGAFSNDTGHVELKWKRVDEGTGDKLIITWTERGGPEPVKPEKPGFGSKLIKNTIVGSLGGTISNDWGTEGLTCEFTFDYNSLTGVHTDDQ